MRILVVSQYFAPEPGATQNRLGAFVDGLVARGHRVTVVCEQPNHPNGVFHPGFGRRPWVTERRPGLVVHRLWVPASPRKTTLRRLAFYGAFAAGVGPAVALAPRHDVLFASSPPMPGVLSAAAAAKVRGTPYVLDIRDLWPAAAEALGEVSHPAALSLLRRAERWLYRNASRVTATTAPFCRHVDEVAGRAVSVHIPNGALDQLLDRPSRPPSPNGPFVVGYAGNLGIAQGLGIVLDAAERLRGEPIRFRLVGDGPRAAALRHESDRRGLTAVEFRPAVPVERVGDVLDQCHALLVPLRAHPVLADFIPSKLYDGMAAGRPVIVAAAGEAARLVGETGCGLVTEPEDGESLAAAVRTLAGDRERAGALGAAGRVAAREHARSRQIERVDAVLTEVVRAGQAE